jgi:hypothetical protein
MSRFGGWLVCLYPREWRERYEEEFIAMLEQCPASLSDSFDVALGALDAWLRPQAVPKGRLFMIAKLRRSVLAVLWAWVGFVVAGSGFQKMTEYDDFVEVAREKAVVGAAFDAVVVGAVVALLAVSVGGLPVAYAALRGAFAEGRKDVPLLFVVPLLALVVFVGYTLLLMRVIYPAVGPLKVHASLNVAFFLSLVAVFLLAAIASTAAVSAAVSRVEVAGGLFRFALWPAAVATLAMAVVLAATVAWGVAMSVQAPALFGGDEGILGTSTVLTWLTIVAVMAACTCSAAVSVARGLSARVAARTERLR